MTDINVTIGEIVSASGGPFGSPTQITPSGKPVSVVLTSFGAGGGADDAFQLDSAFNVGDVVEVYAESGSFTLKDENGNQLSAGGVGIAVRKIRTGGTFPTWGRIRD